jgi:glycosyltransferase involved in cell wall biosynthesis
MLKQSISSVFNQTYSNIELLVVDDCSVNSAGIRSVLEQFPKVKYIRMDNNSGPYVCRNKAITEASGSIIAFQDDDDVSHPQRLEFQLSILSREPVQLVTVSHVRFDKNARLQIDLNGSIFSDGPVTMVFNRSLLDNVGVFKEYRSRGDVEFRSRCKRKLGESSHLHVEVPLYYAFGSQESLSSAFEYGPMHSQLELQREIAELQIV